MLRYCMVFDLHSVHSVQFPKCSTPYTLVDSVNQMWIKEIWVRSININLPYNYSTLGTCKLFFYVYSKIYKIVNQRSEMLEYLNVIFLSKHNVTEKVHIYLILSVEYCHIAGQGFVIM